MKQSHILIYKKSVAKKPTSFLLALGLLLSVCATLVGIQSASGLSVTVPDNGTNIIDYSSNGAETVLTGYSVTPDNSSDTLLVTITLENSPNADRLKLTTTTNLTASYGYTTGSNTFSSFTRISFTGTATNINSALNASFKYRSGGVAPSSAPRVKLSATLNTPGLAYFGTTDHFYKVGHFMSTSGAALGANSQDDGKFCQSTTALANTYISAYSSVQSLSASSTGSSICRWSEANRLARSSTLKGRPGYLANITSAEENDFLKDNLNGALNVWMGGSDGRCNGESAYTQLANSFNYMTDTSIADRCSYTRNDVGGTTGQGNYSSTQTGGTEGAFHWYDGPEAGQTFWRFYDSAAWTHSSWTTWASAARERTAYNTGSEDANSASLTTKHNRPESRYVNWCWTSSGCHEPNNSSSSFTFGGVSNSVQGEDNIVFNWNTADGKWNDLHESEPTVPFYGYIIEYGDGTAFTGVSSSTSTLRMNQTITFSGWAGSSNNEINSLTRGISSSGLTVTHTSQSSTICVVSSDSSSGNIEVTLLNPGTCTIRASQSGDDNYLAATNVDQSFTSNFSSSSNISPTVSLVDPRVSSVSLPELAIVGATNVLACFDESDANGNILGSPDLFFDVSTKGSTQTTGTGNTVISGDRSSALRVSHTRVNVESTLNSDSGISVFVTSGTLNQVRYIRLRIVPIATSTSSGTCSDAVNGASSTIEIRPLELSNTLRKATIQLK
ncbi:MAG: hypothetical protein F2603_03245 [Actinobacteria bacterium]|uniref:Unannotated protein n=1 Tax=freshwater metagenome TaxID=449393 RepID=A0A6J6IP60_9ZZZZ|nr:hypothetical protein [Actinomycetota bacterium]